MKKMILATIALALPAILISGGQEAKKIGPALKVGSVMHGFKLEKKQFVKELDGECYLFRHTQSGARLLKIASQDDNKVFSVAFKTPAPDDTGIPHIMEHSVLNGSEHFPVKSPIDILAQGSLNTFLNAMTRSDFTIYPVASRNDKDFFNLMHVYLDAAYKPLIHKDARILQQEGWHFEMESPEGPLSYKGVVYNEMKGAFSASWRQLEFQMRKALFPNNQYSNCSPGYPDNITDLTNEQFKAFHRKYYHPANSYIYLYGNGDIDKELAFINGNYLTGFNRITVDSHIALQKVLPKPVVKHVIYGVPEGSSVAGKTYIARASVFGRNTDQELNIAMDILADALINHQAAPLRLAMRKAGIGEDISAYVAIMQQPMFVVTVTNTDGKKLADFEKVYVDTLKEIVANGFERTMLEGIINRQEFQLREGRGSFTGVSGALMASAGWMFGEDPFITLSFNKELAAIRSKLDKHYFENLIEKALLKNTHVCTVVMEPKPGLEKELATKLESKLAQIKAKMTPRQIAEIVKQTKNLISYQQRNDDPESLKTIPLLDIADIEKKQEDLTLKPDMLADVPLLFFDTFTKGIVYLDFYFDAGAVDQELIPYAQLYSELVGLMSTDQYSYGDLENQINLQTGGIVTRTNPLTVGRDDKRLKTFFVMSGKAMPEKLGQLVDLMKQQLLGSKWNDEARLKEMLPRIKAQFERRLGNNVVEMAASRLGSYMSNVGSYLDLTLGYAYYQFLNDVCKESDIKKIAGKLQAVQEKIVNRNGMKIGVTCQDEQLAAVKKILPAFVAKLPKGELKTVEYKFAKEALNEGFQDASKVQYVVKGGDYTKFGFKYNGKMEVLSQLLSSVYLQNTLRVQGGAYGVLARIIDSGMLVFASYRDPNLKETLQNYLGAERFLAELQLDERELRRLIIGTISKWDRPLNPAQKGSIAVDRFLRGETLAQWQQNRDEILSTTVEDLKAFAPMIQKVMAEDYLCVVGNEKKIAEQKELFKKILPLRQ